MYDTLEKIGDSTIQHGVNNNRIYLMKLHKNDFPTIIKKIELLAAEKNYSKIFVKIPAWAINGFLADGYVKEANIPGFYNGKIDAYFFSKFIDPSRAIQDVESGTMVDKHIELALSKQGQYNESQKNTAFKLRMLNVDDISQLAKIYSKVFKSYPFPIFDEQYLKETMNNNVVYFGAFNDDKLVAASSAEMDLTAKNVEMTDFATSPDFSGNNLSLVLLREMETQMHKKKMKTFYTIARSYSAGMNITFARQDYKYAGTLINNTNIFGKIESMNVWYKSIV